MKELKALKQLMKGGELPTQGDRWYKVQMMYSDDRENWKKSENNLSTIALTDTIELEHITNRYYRLMEEIVEFSDMLASDIEIERNKELKKVMTNIANDLQDIIENYEGSYEQI